MVTIVLYKRNLTWKRFLRMFLCFHVKHRHFAGLLLNSKTKIRFSFIYQGIIKGHFLHKYFPHLLVNALQFVSDSESSTKPSRTIISSPVCTKPLLFSNESFSCSLTLSTKEKHISKIIHWVK